MPTIERDVVHQGKENGQETIDFPLGRWGHMEASADTLPDLADADLFPVADASDGEQPKRTTWAVIKGAILTAIGIIPVSKGGTGRSTLTSGYFLRGNGTSAVTMSTPTAARQAMSAVTPVGPTTVTLSATAWSGSGPWTQTVTVSGVTASDSHIHVYPVDIADADARKLYEEAYGCLAAQADTAAGGIKFTCREKKPTTNFQVVIEGGRV